MLGKKMQSFTSIMQRNGYYTVATIATDSQYYNAKNAYKSIGFENTFFMGEDKEQRKKWSGKTFLMLFDGVVFDYNLSNLPTYLQNNTPFLNYVLGMYGHSPYERDKIKRPDIIETDCKDDAVNRITNQFYYRTKALAQYIKKITELDPNGLIYVTSDHLPSVFGKDVKYQYEKHINIAFLLDAGKSIDVSEKHYYEIPWLIWDILTKTQHTRPTDKKSLEAIYFQTISESIYGK